MVLGKLINAVHSFLGDTQKELRCTSLRHNCTQRYTTSPIGVHVTPNPVRLWSAAGKYSFGNQGCAKRNTRRWPLNTKTQLPVGVTPFGGFFANRSDVRHI